MKDRKKIMCGGLAFADCEDMEMLHRYALEGWIFREFKGLSYILYKEEPQDLIFSYDMPKLKKEDREDYFRFFEESGWQAINPQCKDDLFFFSAPKGTRPLHTSIETRLDSYRRILYVCIVLCIIGGIALLVSTQMQHTWFQLILFLAGTVLALVGLLMVVAVSMRLKNKRLRVVNLTFVQARMCLVIGLAFFAVRCLLQQLQLIEKGIPLLILATVMSIEGGMFMAFQYRQYKDDKEVRMNKKDEGIL